MYQEKALLGHTKAALYKPKREASEETKPADTFILDCQPPDLWENKCLLF